MLSSSTKAHFRTGVNLAMQLSDPSLFRQQCYIDGVWADAGNGETIDVHNPSTREIIGTIPRMGASETQGAIDAAHAAFQSWRKLTAKDRSKLLRKFADLMMDNVEDLAMIMTSEQGKPLAEARGEVAYAASFMEWFAEEGKRMYGDVIPHDQPGRRIVVIKEPVGVCAAITPWNFPAAMITRKAGPALASGCTIVIKPATQTPYSALALCEIAERAGIPKGVFNVVTGQSSAIGGELTSNDKVRKLTFTGSTAVGKTLMRQCAGTVKKVSLELGGNAPFLVFDDADIDAAVAGAILCKYRNSGQTCVCANRFLVQDAVYDEFAEKFSAAVSEMKVADGLQPNSQIGPLIDMPAVEKVEAHIHEAVEKGAKVVAGGSRHELGGTFFQPTVLTGVSSCMAVANEETFGPLAPIFRFHTEQEAVQMANDTEFGLAAYFYSRDLGRVWRVSEALESGIIGVNTGIISSEVAPFGGVKESGIGREGSKYGIDEFVEVKYLCMAGI